MFIVSPQARAAVWIPVYICKPCTLPTQVPPFLQPTQPSFGRPSPRTAGTDPAAERAWASGAWALWWAVRAPHGLQ